jgi:hypothetical protein
MNREVLQENGLVLRVQQQTCIVHKRKQREKSGELEFMHDLYRQSRLNMIREERLKEMENLSGKKEIHDLAHLQSSLCI